MFVLLSRAVLLFSFRLLLFYFFLRFSHIILYLCIS